jgi:hypothetical protein
VESWIVETDVGMMTKRAGEAVGESEQGSYIRVNVITTVSMKDT